MGIALCSLGISAGNLGIATLYLKTHQTFPAIMWGIAAAGWFGTACLQWRAARLQRRNRVARLLEGRTGSGKAGGS